MASFSLSLSLSLSQEKNLWSCEGFHFSVSQFFVVNPRPFVRNGESCTAVVSRRKKPTKGKTQESEDRSWKHGNALVSLPLSLSLSPLQFFFGGFWHQKMVVISKIASPMLSHWKRERERRLHLRIVGKPLSWWWSPFICLIRTNWPHPLFYFPCNSFGPNAPLFFFCRFCKQMRWTLLWLTWVRTPSRQDMREKSHPKFTFHR